MSTVPQSPSQNLKQPPDTDKFNPATAKGQVNIGPPNVGAGPYLAEPVTGLGKGQTGGPQATAKPFVAPNK